MVDCWRYKEIIKELMEMTKNEEFGVLAITTLPISSKDHTGINAGSCDKIKMDEEKLLNRIKSWIRESNIRIAIIPYEKQIIKKEPDSIVDSAEHQMAHLMGLDNYNFVC